MSAESKHTPGPWIDDTVVDESDHMRVIAAMGNRNAYYSIAELYGPDREANARLIAAAPTTLRQRDELLAALTKLLAGCESYLAARGDTLQISGMIAARAFIAAVEKEAR